MASGSKPVANKKQFSQMMQERHANLTKAYMDTDFNTAPKGRQQKETQKSREPEAKQRDQ